MKTLLCFLLILMNYCGINAQSQEKAGMINPISIKTSCNETSRLPDSAKMRFKKDHVVKFAPVPKKSALMALLPGGGQIYNRDYWKLPLIYLGIGGGVYSYYLNKLKYNDLLEAYKSFYVIDPESIYFGQLKPDINPDTKHTVRMRNLLNTKSDYRTASRDNIEKAKNYWRRNKNLSIIATGLIYTLTIIEANVAAHLKTFDLSDDLTLRLRPDIISLPLNSQSLPAVCLVLNFK